ncbi:MAG: hypothetical protein A2X24_05110 [Chloroflexi bacterium GWB2_54_36]|nr:MAG: hypothetical protein A2X24_05110 [Chloroflexi bacterium GWB2_54_36]HBA92105.1 hypothetical protein [Anaerolineaceae bacterium]
MEKQDHSHNISALMGRIDLEKPKPQDVDEFRRILREVPELIQTIGKLSVQSRNRLIETGPFSNSMREILAFDIELLAKSLEYDTSTPLEQLIIDNILSCYLRYHIYEITYHEMIGKRGTSLTVSTKWEQVLSYSQRRYHQSIELLVKMRRLGINVQVNIATKGGQQINLTKQSGGLNGS